LPKKPSPFEGRGQGEGEKPIMNIYIIKESEEFKRSVILLRK
jgi:hypothetical protein